MKLSPTTIIASAKIKEYLLKWLPENDKSQFLAQAGYEIEDAIQLEWDLRSQILPLDAVFMGNDRFGSRYKIRGNLIGPNGKQLSVTTIWMIEKTTKQTKFVTLFPDKES